MDSFIGNSRQTVPNSSSTYLILYPKEASEQAVILFLMNPYFVDVNILAFDHGDGLHMFNNERSQFRLTLAGTGSNVLLVYFRKYQKITERYTMGKQMVYKFCIG